MNSGGRWKDRRFAGACQLRRRIDIVDQLSTDAQFGLGGTVSYVNHASIRAYEDRVHLLAVEG